MRPHSVAAVIAAGGRGERFNGAGAVAKQFLLLAGKPIYLWSLETLCTHRQIDQVVVVGLASMLDQINLDVQKYCAPFLHKILVTAGGARRQDSVHLGLEALAKQSSIPKHVLVHDAARPFISTKDIDQILETLSTCKGCTLAVPASDTIKRVRDNMIVETIERSELYMVQTPQAFEFSILLEVHRQAQKDKCQVTDDVALLENIDVPVKIVIGSTGNFKITSRDDLRLAEAVVACQLAAHNHSAEHGHYRQGTGY
jgi:2-C-methyl-D-erythritol 4-phosphate cytidylyltransferase